MADQLATPADLTAALQLTTAIDSTVATLLLECSASVVQEAAGDQRIVQVVGDVLTIQGTTDSWLALPQIPVTTVTSVVLDGTTLTTAANDYKVVGNRLWRRLGWQTNWGWPIDWPYPVWGINGTPFNWQGMLSEPSLVLVTYTHGYASGSQDLQLARNASLSLCKGAYTNPGGVSSEKIDDYEVMFERMSAQMEASPYLKAALKRKYGRRAALVRIG